jgi:hydroxyethylthiazole kinase-like uncharacterized protein yjeF
MTTQLLLQSDALRAIESANANASPPLMDRAGKAAAALALKLQSGLGGPPLVLAGPGNNGGDAFVVARLLKKQGLDPVVVFLGQRDTLPHDARLALDQWLAVGKVNNSIPPQRFGLVVDGLFGIGISRPLENPYLSLIERINTYGGPVLALDCPSGLNTDTGTINPIAVHASHTMTFIANKPGLLTLNGPDHCGLITVADLVLAEAVVRTTAAGRINDPSLFTAGVSPRQGNSHKGSFGSAGIIGGAPGMAGAALLAGSAALKLGAGRTFVGMLERLAVDFNQPELMLREVNEIFGLATALAIGPGLGQSDQAVELLRRAVDTEMPLVVDADALNLLAAHPALARRVARRTLPTLITPHPAEAARLLDSTVDAIQADRVASALELARRYQANVVLKGNGSIIATAAGKWFINTTGNAGLASGGSGDVLTGISLALLAQGWSGESAALGATWLHGRAADDLVAEGAGPIGIAAGELIAPARRLLNRLVYSRPG